MGSDKRIPCSEETFETLSDLKDSRGDTWDQLLLWLYEDAREDPLQDHKPLSESDVQRIVSNELADMMNDVERQLERLQR